MEEKPCASEVMWVALRKVEVMVVLLKRCWHQAHGLVEREEEEA